MINVLLIVWIHFVSDFILQSDIMAINKSKNVKYLLLHCFIYSLLFLVFGWEFSLIAFLSHFIIDFFTSKLTSYLWQKEKRHWFFCTIGFDQALHLTVLFLVKLFLENRI